MTREEAIQRLKNIDIREALQEDYDAIDMAIEALSEPSIVRCGECKHWSEDEKQEAMSGRWCSICKYFSEYNENNTNEIYTSEYAFCSFGERREP